jgi:hypothetical protein
MKTISFISQGGKRIQIIERQEEVSDGVDYYILRKDMHRFHYVANILLKRYNEKIITGKIASELVEKNLLWKTHKS